MNSPSEQRRRAHEGDFVGVFARNCEVRRISSDVADAFLSRHHSLGATGSRYRYGIFISRPGRCGIPVGTLVAVSTFSAARKWRKADADGNPLEIRSYEWIRYSSLPDVRVIGGMGKALRAFIEETNPDDIMTYVMEERWKEGLSGAAPAGDVYRKLGFSEETAADGKIKFRLKLTGYENAMVFPE